MTEEIKGCSLSTFDFILLGSMEMIDPGLVDKEALVTGANHGIGAVTAFATHGTKVVTANLD